WDATGLVTRNLSDNRRSLRGARLRNGTGAAVDSRDALGCQLRRPGDGAGEASLRSQLGLPTWPDDRKRRNRSHSGASGRGNRRMVGARGRAAPPCPKASTNDEVLAQSLLQSGQVLGYPVERDRQASGFRPATLAVEATGPIRGEVPAAPNVVTT